MKKETILSLMVLLCVFVWLCLQINTFYVPDSDFTYYLLVGRLMFSNPLSSLIISAPLYPVVVYLLQLALPVKYPGLTGGIVFNILCFTLTVYFMWNIAKKYLNWYAIFPIALFVINPLVLYVNLQPINLPLGLLLVVAALYFFEKRPALSYALAIFALLARGESAVLFIVFFICDKFFKKRPHPPPWALACFILVLAWNLRPLEQSHTYLSEISARQKEVPNVTFVRNSLVTAPWSYNLLSAFEKFPISGTEALVTVIMVVWAGAGAFWLFRNNRQTSIPLLGFVAGYSVIHIFFPDRVLRYSYPLLPFVYLLLFYPIMNLRKKLTKVSRHLTDIFPAFVLFVCFGTMSLLNKGGYIENQRWDRSERRFVAEWLNQNITKPTKVFVFEFYVHNYYLDNDNITYVETTKQTTWTQDLCRFSEDVYIVFDNQTESEGSYFDHLHGIDFFKKIWEVNKSEPVLDPIYSFEKSGRRASVYKFTKPNNEWCRNMELQTALPILK